MHEQIEKIQLLENPQRYGNKAFNDYYTWLCSNAYQLIEEILVPGPDCCNFKYIYFYVFSRYR